MGTAHTPVLDDTLLESDELRLWPYTLQASLDGAVSELVDNRPVQCAVTVGRVVVRGHCARAARVWCAQQRTAVLCALRAHGLADAWVWDVVRAYCGAARRGWLPGGPLLYCSWELQARRLGQRPWGLGVFAVNEAHAPPKRRRLLVAQFQSENRLDVQARPCGDPACTVSPSFSARFRMHARKSPRDFDGAEAAVGGFTYRHKFVPAEDGAHLTYVSRA